MFLKRSIWIEFEDKSPISLKDIMNNAFMFYRLIKMKEDDLVYTKIIRLIKVRKYLENCRIIVKTLIVPERNEYIKQYDEQYKLLNDNLGRLDKRLDKLEDEAKILEDYPRSPKSKTGELKLNGFASTMETIMEHTVLQPIKMAIEQYISLETIEEKDYKIVKDKDLFIYFLFLQLYHASFSLGSLTREEKKLSTETIISPPEIPKNVRQEFIENQENSTNNEPIFKEEEVVNEPL